MEREEKSPRAGRETGHPQISQNQPQQPHIKQVKNMQWQQVPSEIEPERPAHDAEIQVSHGPEVVRVIYRIHQVLDELGRRNLGRPAYAIQFVALEKALVSAAIGDQEQQSNNGE